MINGFGLRIFLLTVVYSHPNSSGGDVIKFKSFFSNFMLKLDYRTLKSLEKLDHSLE